MPSTFLDHITVAAPTLKVGAAFVHAALGVAPQAGGEHPRMATHNCLLRLGDALFLEVIAPNPAAPAPSRPRWFGLDQLGPQSPPCLATWVVRTTDIRSCVAAATEPLGSVEPMCRGALDWLITIPKDGSLPLHGAAPALIEWHTGGHPADRLEDKGLSLAQLDILHPDPDRIKCLLASLELEAPVHVYAAPPGARVHLLAHIDTPQGRRVLGSVPAVSTQPARP